MFAKLGFLLLIVLFGAFAFIGGAMTPDAWRQSIAGLGGRLSERLHALPSTASLPADAAHAAKAAAAGSAAPVEGTATPAVDSTSPVPLDALLVMAKVDPLAPARGQPAYALQLGQFVTSTEATAAERRFRAAGLDLPMTRLAAVDAENEPWTVLAIGRFASPAAARQAAPRVQDALHVPSPPVIQLPLSAKPSP
ncbi:MAG: SPOR domain-containing protein [Xanthomonadaceae bacterium]|nr:SPOR domain-containing protein [Xanthomonadaceae bacterium]